MHPNAADPEQHAAAVTVDVTPDPPPPPPPTVLTVWRRSLLFNCDGFTVFDARGDLAFRVDSYDASGRRRAEVVLMDATGTPLLTVRRKRRLGVLVDHWVIYDGDAADAEAAEPSATSSKPLLSVRRRHRRASSSSSSRAKALAYVTPLQVSSSSYVVEGSYGRRACVVREPDHARGDAVVAEVRRKEAVLGDDVFRLVVEPRLGATLAMGLVIALDEMFAGGRSSARSSSSSSLLRSRTWSV